MRRGIWVLIIGLVATGITGTADGAEERTYSYSAGTNVGAPGVSPAGMVVCPDACSIGGFRFDHPRSAASATASDAAWGENVGALYCVRAFPGGPWCGQDPDIDSVPDRAYSHGPVCGSTIIPLDPHPFDPVGMTFVYTTLVLEDLSVCGASTGTMTITH